MLPKLDLPVKPLQIKDFICKNAQNLQKSFDNIDNLNNNDNSKTAKQYQ